MTQNNNFSRYNKNNMYIVYLDDMGLIYDVPTNTIFKTSSETAKNLKLLQDSCDEILSINMNKKLKNKKITNPSHSFWWETKVIHKITFNVTSRCNLRCKYCYANFGKYSDYSLNDMNPLDAIKYIDSLIDIGVYHIGHIQFFGGEPLLSINTIESICEHLTNLYKQRKIDSIPIFKMITNFVFDNKHICDVILKYNIRLTISIDGPQKIHDIQRIFPNGRGSYEFIEKNINILKDNIVGIESTYTKNHIENNISLKQLNKYLSDKFNLPKSSIMIVPVTGNKQLEVPKNSELLQDRNDGLTNEDGNILFAYYPEKQSDMFCSAGFNSLCIMPNGDFYPCHMYAMDRQYCLGNVLEDYNFYEIKNKLYNLPLKSKNDYDECKDCWARKICHLCPAKSLISHNNEKFISNDKCKKRKEHYEKVLIKSVYN